MNVRLWIVIAIGGCIGMGSISSSVARAVQGLLAFAPDTLESTVRMEYLQVREEAISTGLAIQERFVATGIDEILEVRDTVSGVFSTALPFLAPRGTGSLGDWEEREALRPGEGHQFGQHRFDSPACPFTEGRSAVWDLPLSEDGWVLLDQSNLPYGFGGGLFLRTPEGEVHAAVGDVGWSRRSLLLPLEKGMHQVFVCSGEMGDYGNPGLRFRLMEDPVRLQLGDAVVAGRTPLEQWNLWRLSLDEQTPLRINWHEHSDAAQLPTVRLRSASASLRASEWGLTPDGVVILNRGDYFVFLDPPAPAEELSLGLERLQPGPLLDFRDYQTESFSFGRGTSSFRWNLSLDRPTWVRMSTSPGTPFYTSIFRIFRGPSGTTEVQRTDWDGVFGVLPAGEHEMMISAPPSATGEFTIVGTPCAATLVSEGDFPIQGELVEEDCTFSPGFNAGVATWDAYGLDIPEEGIYRVALTSPDFQPLILGGFGVRRWEVRGDFTGRLERGAHWLLAGSQSGSEQMTGPYTLELERLGEDINLLGQAELESAAEEWGENPDRLIVGFIDQSPEAGFPAPWLLTWQEKESHFPYSRVFLREKAGKTFCLVTSDAPIRLTTYRSLLQVNTDPGVCRFFWAFGAPGPEVKDWLMAGGALYGQKQISGDTPEPGQLNGLRRGPTGLVLRSTFSIRGEACAAGDREACLDLFVTPSKVTFPELSESEGEALGLPAVIQCRTHECLLQDPFYGRGERILFDLENEFGTERFTEFWKSGQEVDEAFLDAFEMPVEEWIYGWAQTNLPGAVQGPRILPRTWAYSLVLTILSLLGAVYLSSRRTFV